VDLEAFLQDRVSKLSLVQDMLLGDLHEVKSVLSDREKEYQLLLEEYQQKTEQLEESEKFVSESRSEITKCTHAASVLMRALRAQRIRNRDLCHQKQFLQSQWQKFQHLKSELISLFNPKSLEYSTNIISSRHVSFRAVGFAVMAIRRFFQCGKKSLVGRPPKSLVKSALNLSPGGRFLSTSAIVSLLGNTSENDHDVLAALVLHFDPPSALEDKLHSGNLFVLLSKSISVLLFPVF
jgi:hypothetical protein